MRSSAGSAALTLVKIWPFGLNFFLHPFNTLRLFSFPSPFSFFSSLMGSLFVFYALLN
jgi:uncharacterized membrane protein